MCCRSRRIRGSRDCFGGPRDWQGTVDGVPEPLRGAVRFGLALATYLLYNYISTLPREILESAFIDGASHFRAFTQLVLPLSLPALASFAIFQFLWVWNDYLVALVILGPNPNVRVVTMKLADIVGDRGQDWYLLTAGAFLSMVVPLIVFFSLQRYFVRGLLAGSVKG